ncbi:MAG TPA: NUDIX domain-containing protein [Gemmatimonadaceae bacterium]
MISRRAVSSGILLYRRTKGMLEIFLAHPGGPFWAKRDDGAWTIPKGVVDDGEELLDGARREFREETGIEATGPYESIGSVKQKAGKTVHAWAWEGDADPSTIVSNTTKTEWPRGSGKWLTYPEIDRCAWFDVETARAKINPAQSAFIDRVASLLENSGH